MGKYDEIIQWVFTRNHRPGNTRVAFNRDELIQACDALGFAQVKNVGDIPYTFRFRRELPGGIREAAPISAEWIIVGIGIGEYQFRLADPGKIQPTPHFHLVKVPDATPEIVQLYASGTDEQALLTRARYNRLVDLFTGLSCYSIQNHLRTTVKEIGQVEVDEIYVGMNRRGTHFVLPCQEKSPGDSFGIVQVIQDMALCAERYPNALCRPIALQFLSSETVALMELGVQDRDDILKLTVIDEKHYALVSRNEISGSELRLSMEGEA